MGFKLDRSRSNCVEVDRTRIPPKSGETIAKTLCIMGNGRSRSNLIELLHQISWRDYAGTEEKICEQKDAKVTK